MDGNQTSPLPSVLCAVDDSAAAARAALVAAEMADSLGLRLVLAHVPADPDPGGDEEPESHRVLQVPAPTVRAPVTRVRMPWGEPVEGICRASASENAVLLVVGNRGRGPMAAALLGSVSRALAARAPVPVLVVPAGRVGPLRPAHLAPSHA